jgi:hypothetical protein
MTNLPILYTIRDRKTKLNIYRTIRIEDILKDTGGTIKNGDIVNIYLGDTISNYKVIEIRPGSIGNEQLNQQQHPCVTASLIWVSLIKD